jgi:glycosyltransferase involved in cell wall biosynthesis
MIYLFWFSLAAISYVCVGYPLLITLLARWRPLPWRRAPWTGPVPPVSVVMDFNKDASQLSEQVAHLLSLDPSLIKEIIVVADGSSGATPAVLPYVADKRVRIVLLHERVSRSAALDHGIAAASSEISLQPGAIAALLSNFADVAIGCVAGEMIPDTQGNPAAAAIFGPYWVHERRIRSREALFDSTPAPHGAFYAIRRVLARPVPAGLILKDGFQSLAIRRQGYRSVIDRSAVAIDAWSTSCASEFRTQARTLAGNLQLIAKAPWILRRENRVRFQLVSHPTLRLLAPYFFLLLLLSSLLLGEHSVVYLSIAFLQTAFWLIAAVSLKAPIFLRRVAGTAGALLVLNAAAMAGLFMFLFPRSRFRKIWAPKFAFAKKGWRNSLSNQRPI